MFDFVTAGAIIIWALTIGVLPTHQLYSRIPTVDWKFFLRHEHFTAIALAVLLVAGVIAFFWVRRRVDEFRAHVSQGFTILRDRPRFLKRVILPQTISWFFRIASLFFFLKAFGVRRTSTTRCSRRSSTRSRRCSRRRPAARARSKG